MFVEIAESLRESYATPAQRAALYEVASRLPGVRLLGIMRDRAGRAGTAVAMDDDSDGTRTTPIFDKSAGAMLAEEYTALAGNPYRVPPGTGGALDHTADHIVHEPE